MLVSPLNCVSQRLVVDHFLQPVKLRLLLSHLLLEAAEVSIVRLAGRDIVVALINGGLLNIHSISVGMVAETMEL